jgi:mRNA interferase MazF
MKEETKRFFDWTKIKINLHKLETIVFAQEREIWWASLGINIGFEQNGKHEAFERPILILKKFNKHLLWVLPLTSQQKTGKWYFSLEYNGKISYAILSQIKALREKWFLLKFGTSPQKEFA